MLRMGYHKRKQKPCLGRDVPSTLEAGPFVDNGLYHNRRKKPFPGRAGGYYRVPPGLVPIPWFGPFFATPEQLENPVFPDP